MFENEKYEVNELVGNKRYITKSKINSKLKKEYPMLKNIPLKDIKETFDECRQEVCRVGNPEIFWQQKHIRFVDREELVMRVLRDYSHLPHRK